MKSNINLIAVRNISQESHQHIVRRFRFIGLSAIGFIACLSLLLFVVKMQIGLSQYKQQELSALQELNSLHGKQAKVIFLNQRLQLISVILSTRPALDKEFGSIYKTIPEGITIDAFQLEEKKLRMTLSSSSLLSFDNFLSVISNMAERNDLFKSITMNSMQISSQKYTLSVEALLL